MPLPRPIVALLMIGCLATPCRAEPVTLIAGGQARTSVVIDAGECTRPQQEALEECRQWLIGALQQATGVALPVADALPAGPAVVFTTVAQHQPSGADTKKIRSQHDAYAIVSDAGKLWLVPKQAYFPRLAGSGTRPGIAA